MYVYIYIYICIYSYLFQQFCCRFCIQTVMFALSVKEEDEVTKRPLPL